MKVLVTGRHGQVASALAELARERNDEITFLSRNDLDLSDVEGIASKLEGHRFDVLVSAAAYTAVDRAEDEPELAQAINAHAPAALAEAACKSGARIIHLSTDYVFSGVEQRKYTEGMETNPLGVYGKSKLKGEHAVRTFAPSNHIILRTSWVYSPFGTNFVKTMMRLAETRPEISVVTDQVGCPTSAFDIAEAILSILDHWQDDTQTGLGQTFHLAGAGETSWFGFAREIFAQSGAMGGPVSSVTGISTDEYPTKAKRPLNSRLDSSRFKGEFGVSPEAWQSALKPVIKRLIDAKRTN